MKPFWLMGRLGTVRAEPVEARCAQPPFDRLRANGVAYLVAGSLAALALAGCAAGGTPRTGTEAAAACRELPAADGTRLTMIRQTLTAGRPHAALAYLDEAAFDAPEAELLRADALRQTGRADAAAKLYEALRGSCLAGFAHQGLGLIARRAGRLDESAEHLHRARLALPTDAAIRNDYGEALLARGERDEAVHEFLTAMELGADDRRAALNLLFVLVRAGDEDKVAAFAHQAGLSPADVAAVRRRAAQAGPAWPDDARPVLGPAPAAPRETAAPPLPSSGVTP
ncbi:tetratricopeptide repeat protein [Pseudothauera rhizosphaerae]|uniref:Flp pilus assembly protein TadD, contains TPR repeats n=1 Tax=Pseudothauera rhizosphaerae TaxID=2565932 RepID=A0A4S4AW66_9RHOO|nr:hypothetical protein [Pseudothauera rhizosphaerae]THF64274.1 hypothetical protein E6O51_02865 [Pseudothauera rhizosphaerae]